MLPRINNPTLNDGVFLTGFTAKKLISRVFEAQQPTQILLND